jgi:L-lactate dehydrogenase complex protein LldG
LEEGLAVSADLVGRFSEMLAAVGGTAHGPLAVDDALDLLVELCKDPVMVQLGVEGCLSDAGFEVLTPEDVFWQERLADAGVGVTGAVIAAAASGTVGIACGPLAPRATSLVPPAHICLVLRDTMVEELAEAVRRRMPAGSDDDLPSNLVWVSGPSRSADLELVLTVGVHGPGSVDVIVVDQEKSG